MTIQKLRLAAALLLLLATVLSPLPVLADDELPSVHRRGGNIPVHDPELGQVFKFPPDIPFFNFNQSEATIAAHGSNIVAAYNTDAYEELFGFDPDGLFIGIHSRIGVSRSSDGGKTWLAAPLAPPSANFFPYTDPVLDVDRHGTFFLVNIAFVDFLAGSTGVQVHRSTDGGVTWTGSVAQAAVLPVQVDKPWIAVGPDPSQKQRDNVYLVWQNNVFRRPFRTELGFARSVDGGVTWTTKVIFVPSPDPNPVNPQARSDSATPYVDRVTGDLYVPFHRFSFSNVDFVQMLVSRDAGETFSLVEFNIPPTPGHPSVPNGTLVPFVYPGVFNDCGPGGVMLVLKAGTDVGGRFGVPRYVNATRLVNAQPAFAARNGALYLAYSSSTSSFVGDVHARSSVLLIRSNDGGATWSAPTQVNPEVSSELHHVMPSLALGPDGNNVHIGYYTQHDNEMIDVDLSTSPDQGVSFPASRRVRVTSAPFPLGPSNIPVDPGFTYNPGVFDPCYQLGDYIHIKEANGKVYVLWADGRNSITHPPDPFDPLSGVTHPQVDVFFQGLTVP